MLKHEDTPQINPQSAAQVRVTPEELAAAVTALQIRKEGQPGTIAIGEAVNELGLDVTPEEVLAEVEARREKKKKKLSRSRYSIMAAGFALFMAMLGDLLWHVHHPTNHSKLIPMVSLPEIQSVLLPETQSLASVPDGHEFYADAHALAQLFQKVRLSQIMVHRKGEKSSWQLIKHSSKIYLISYVSSNSENQLRQNHTLLYSAPPKGYLMEEENGHVNYTIATVPIAGVRLEDTQMGEFAEKIIVSNIRTDSHVWEEN